MKNPLARLKALASAIGFSAIALAGANSVQAADPEVTLKFHHMLPPMSGAHRDFIAPWAEKVEKESNGRIKIEIYPAMQLGGKPPHLFDQARKGKVDITWTVGGYTPGRFPTAGAFELPFMPTNAEATSMALQEFAEQEMQDELKDVKLLAMHTHAPGSLHSRDKAIKTAEDLNGLKLRAPNKLMSDALNNFGTNPIFMPVPQMPSALQKGVMDVTMLPFEVVRPLKIHQLVKHHTEVKGDRGLYTQFFLFVMNKNTYNKLPDDLKKVIDNNSGVETAGFIGRAFDKNEQLGYEAAVAQGNSFYTLPDAEVARWKEKLSSANGVWKQEMKDAGKDGEALYKKATALIDKYAKQVAASK